jgi:plastocyanin
MVGSRLKRVSLFVVLVLSITCKKSPTAPSASDLPSVQTLQVTITASGASPRNVSVALGSRVLFVNNDSHSHNMTSDPHPEHTDCPDLNQVGFLSPGQSRETGNLVVARTCGFHDHDNPDNQTLHGQIVIQ